MHCFEFLFRQRSRSSYADPPFYHCLICLYYSYNQPIHKFKHVQSSYHHNHKSIIIFNIITQPLTPRPLTLMHKPLLFVLTLTLACHCMQFNTQIQSQQRFCFYQVLDAQQKYTFTSYSEAYARYGREWRSVVFRTSENNRPMTRIDKLTSIGTTYSFCVKNIASENTKFKIEFKSGLEVMQLHELPDASDGENLERELNWLDQQTVMLSHRAENIEGLRRINYQLNGMVGNSMVIFAVIGLAVIAGVNWVFFKMLRKTFKERKLI